MRAIQVTQIPAGERELLSPGWPTRSLHSGRASRGPGWSAMTNWRVLIVFLFVTAAAEGRADDGARHIRGGADSGGSDIHGGGGDVIDRAAGQADGGQNDQGKNAHEGPL